jgi:succinate dehydrogenase / fumarate reductase membrane anchor subunit
VIEDYVHHEGPKIVLVVLNQFFAWLVGAACVFALVKIAL